MDIRRIVFHRAQHVTGPSAVLVSIQFGKMPAGGPRIVRLLAAGKQQAEVSFDLENHVAEILSGVARANQELRGALEVETIEVVPDDYPHQAQAEHLAYQIALAALRNGT